MSIVNNDITPTKSVLIQTRKLLDLAVEGFDLLDRKRYVLVGEMMNRIDDAKKVQKEIREEYEKAYKALATSNITLGINTVEHIAMGIEEERSISIRFRSIMGVEIPEIRGLPPELHPPYGFYRTNPALDRAYIGFRKALALTIRLAEIETAVYRLAAEIKKTQKRANALDHILIPQYKRWVNYIQGVLEEKEREDFARLKIMKSRRELNGD